MATPLYPSDVRQKIQQFEEEIDSIHFANRLYWQQPGHTGEAIAIYEERCERLEFIRKELTAITHEHKITE